MKKQAIIVGCENFALMLDGYLEELGVKVAAFTVDPAYIVSESVADKPVISLMNVKERFPSEQYDCYLGIGYTQMGLVRRSLGERLRSLGYTLPNLIHPTVFTGREAKLLGDANIILERVIIGSMAQIGTGNILWPGANIGHNACIGNWNTLSLNAVMCGFSEVKDHCFLGANSCIRDHVCAETETLIGASAYISANTEAKSVWVSPRAVKLSKASSEIVI